MTQGRSLICHHFSRIQRYSCGDSAADANPFPGSPADLKQKGDWTWACPEFNAFLPPPTPGVEPAPRDPGAGHVQVLLPH